MIAISYSISMILLFLRQIPGLCVVSKQKKKSAPNAPTRTRPPPIERIAAQRAQRRSNPEQQADPDLAPASNISQADGENIQPLPDDDLEDKDQDPFLPNANDG